MRNTSRLCTAGRCKRGNSSVPPALTGGFFGYFLLTATAYVATERMTPPTNAGGTDLISHFALAANGNVSAPKPNKSATDSNESAALYYPSFESCRDVHR